MKDVWRLRLVGLNLVKGFPDVGMHVGRILQLDQHQRQAIDEEHDIRPAGMVGTLDRVLVDRQPFVVGCIGPVNQADKIAPSFPVFLILHRHPADQQLVKVPICGQQGGNAQIHHLFERIFLGDGWKPRIKPVDGFAQAKWQEYKQYVSYEGALALLSGWTGIDFGTGSHHATGNCEVVKTFTARTSN